MLTFVEFYATLMGFVNFKLYHSLNLKYPPQVCVCLCVCVYCVLCVWNRVIPPSCCHCSPQIEGLPPPPAAQSLSSQIPEPDLILGEETEDHTEVGDHTPDHTPCQPPRHSQCTLQLCEELWPHVVRALGMAAWVRDPLLMYEIWVCAYDSGSLPEDLWSTPLPLPPGAVPCQLDLF